MFWNCLSDQDLSDFWWPTDLWSVCVKQIESQRLHILQQYVETSFFTDDKVVKWYTEYETHVSLCKCHNCLLLLIEDCEIVKKSQEPFDLDNINNSKFPCGNNLVQ